MKNHPIYHSLIYCVLHILSVLFWLLSELATLLPGYGGLHFTWVANVCTLGAPCTQDKHTVSLCSIVHYSIGTQ